MKKILFVADVEGWAYDDAAKNWKKLLKDEYEIDIIYLSDYELLKPDHRLNRVLKEYQTLEANSKGLYSEKLTNYMFKNKSGSVLKPIFNHEEYDGILFFYHKAICDNRLLNTPFPLDKAAVSINNEKWVSDGVRYTYDGYFKGSKVLVCCNSFIIEKFKNIHPKVLRASQAINPKVFFTDKSLVKNKNFTVGWSGNYNNKIKNFDLVRKACKKSGVDLVTAKNLSRQELNLWYQNIDTIVCASKSEGGPLMLLEAGACSVPVITTPVGLSREIIKDKHNGLITDWSLESISSAISYYKNNEEERLKHAKALNKEILDNWTYESRLNEIREVLKHLTEG